MLTKLIIANYIPLLKKGTKRVELNTQHIFNIIFGRNGHGKSGLLREMSPLPPDNNKYEEDGYKEIHYLINGKKYKLISETGKKGKHQFIVDGVNLNEGNTLSVQRSLVRQHFGINNEIKSILTGLDVSDRLSSLSTERRKNFLMYVNPNDTSIALKKYEKVKALYNQTRGALKHQRERLNNEYVRQVEMSNMNIDELKERIGGLDTLIKQALVAHGELMNVKDPDIETMKRELERLMLDMLNFDYNKRYLSEGEYRTKQERNEKYLSFLEHKVTAITERIKLSLEKINGLDLPAEFGKKGYEIKLEELTKQINHIENERKEKLSFIKSDPFFENDVWFEESVVYGFEELESLLLNVEVTPDKDITSSLYGELNKELIEIKNIIINVEREIADRLHVIKHYENSDLINCPKCSHNFKIGFENKNIDEIKKELQVLNNSLLEHKKKETSIADRIAINDGWYSTMVSLLRFVKRSAHVEYYMDMVKHYNVGKEECTLLVNRLKSIREVLSMNREQEDLISRQTTINAQFKLFDECDIDKLFIDVEKLNEELSLTERELSHHKQLHVMINDDLDELLSNQLVRERFIILFDELKESLVEKGRFDVKSRIVESINNLTTEKDTLMNVLIRSENITAIVLDMEKSVDELEKREKHLKIHLDGLSPTKGFIGFLMVEFINTIISNVNALIKPLWTERLKIKPLELGKEDVEMSYSFPVITGSDNKTNSDVKECSGGERELIDVIFRLVMVMYLGEITGVPNIMDEVGVALDELHRARFFSFIEEQYRTGKLPQTFMVSHYINQYGMFENNVNAIALNIEGLTVPMETNKDSVIN